MSKRQVQQKDSKNWFLGAARVTFECFRQDTCSIQKHYYLLWFKHVLRLLAVFFSHLKSTRTHTVHQMCFLLFFLRYFWRPRDAQGRSKAGPRSRKGATRTPQGIPGILKNRLKITLGHHLVSQGRPGGSRGTRRKEIHTKIY